VKFSEFSLTLKEIFFDDGDQDTDEDDMEEQDF